MARVHDAGKIAARLVADAAPLLVGALAPLPVVPQTASVPQPRGLRGPASSPAMPTTSGAAVLAHQDVANVGVSAILGGATLSPTESEGNSHLR